MFRFYMDFKVASTCPPDSIRKASHLFLRFANHCPAVLLAHVKAKGLGARWWDFFGSKNWLIKLRWSCSFVNNESRLRNLFVGDFGIFDSHDSHSHFHSHDFKIEYNNANKARPWIANIKPGYIAHTNDLQITPYSISNYSSI